MRKPLQMMLVATGVAAVLAGSIATAQVTGTFASHLNAAKAAAGTFAGKLKARRDAEELVDQAIAGAMKA